MAIEIGAGITMGGGILVLPDFPPGAPIIGTANDVKQVGVGVTHRF
jgi:hypothetical protein